ncbi:hypothetical protein LQV63_23460 [Paenibacillus profundus]|uniref:Uncharacterized protein n=1 Tax=Paenibacillus profundus TaxID=1173085 RepID=A0ABS8YKA1_9BACL|nr:hypothetical protein [Paenibacillus profundus]MCE5172241.1 hypothetical protein [Paenibacillus profundus]
MEAVLKKGVRGTGVGDVSGHQLSVGHYSLAGVSNLRRVGENAKSHGVKINSARDVYI